MTVITLIVIIINSNNKKDKKRYPEPIKVIRVENTEGYGMFMFTAYSCDEILPELYDRHFGPDAQDNSRREAVPPPHFDCKNIGDRKTAFDCYGKKYKCAFKSLNQFNRLIRKNEVKVLLQFYDIYLIETYDYAEFDNQIMYNPKTIVSKKNINSLFE